MRLFTFSYAEKHRSSVYQVIAQNEKRARELLINDGHPFADNPKAYELETVFPLEDGAGESESIPFTLEFGEVQKH